MLFVHKDTDESIKYHLAEEPAPTTALCGKEVVPSTRSLVNWMFLDIIEGVPCCKECEGVLEHDFVIDYNTSKK